MINKIRKVFNTIINKIPVFFYLMFICLFTIILLSVIIYNNTNLVNLKLLELLLFNSLDMKKISILLLIISTILYILLFYFIYNLIKQSKNRKKIIIICSILFVVIQLAFGFFFSVKPSWDFGFVYDIVLGHIQGTQKLYDAPYLHRYGNNLGVTLLLKNVFSIFHIIGFNKHFISIGILFNIFMIDVSIFFMYKMFKLFFDDKISLFFLICSFMFLPFITYTPIFYTDTLSMPFIIIAAYYFIKMIVNNKFSMLEIIISGLMIGLGACIKFSAMIVLVAIIISSIFYKINIKEKLKYLSILVIFAMIPVISLNIYQKLMFDQKSVEEVKFPVTHWLMMGLKTSEHGVPGGFNIDDVGFTANKIGVDGKKSANIIEIKNRVKDKIKNKTLMEYYIRKTVFVWGDGSFFASNVLSRYNILNYKINKVILGNERQTLAFRCISQATMIIILTMFISAVSLRKYLDEKQNKLLLLNTITIFGVFLFFLLWEARSRYLINFSPIILLETYLGVVAVSNKIKNNKGV